MSTITISLAEDRLALLREQAARQGVPPEELARRGVEELLDRPEAFRKAAEHVLLKNAELYNRLAR